MVFPRRKASLACKPRAPRVRVDSLVREYRALQRWNSNDASDSTIPPPRAKLDYLHDGMASMVRAGRQNELPPELKSLLRDLVIVARATGNRTWLRKLRSGAERGVPGMWTAHERTVYLEANKLLAAGHSKRQAHKLLCRAGLFAGNMFYLVWWRSFCTFLAKHRL